MALIPTTIQLWFQSIIIIIIIINIIIIIIIRRRMMMIIMIMIVIMIIITTISFESIIAAKFKTICNTTLMQKEFQKQQVTIFVLT